MPGEAAVLGGVAVGLALLNPHAYSKGLGLQVHAPPVEHGSGVPGGMAGAENQMAAGQGLCPLRSGDPDAGEDAILNLQILQPGFKADVRPQG